jgi:hypothetical protein
MRKAIDILEDYNTRLTNDTRAEISDYIEGLLSCLDGCVDLLTGIKLDISVNSDVKKALQDKIDDIEKFINEQLQ